VLRARVEAMRAEAQASQALAGNLALRSAVTGRRAERDRASESLVAAERRVTVSTRALPAPDVDAGAPAAGGAR
jgi:hypothetical protein